MTTTIVTVDGEELEIPTCLIEDREIFSEVVSLDTWNHVIKEEEDRQNLEQLLPQTEAESHEDVVKSLFSGANSRFGQCPVDEFWQRLHSGALSPEVQAAQSQLRQLKYHQYKLNQKSHYVHLLQEILVSRQQLLQSALFEGSLDKLPLPSLALPTGGQKPSIGGQALKAKANKKYKKILSDIRSECGQVEDMSSDDEDDVTPKPTNQVAEVTVEQPISEEEYHRMLRKHRKRRMRSKVSLNLVMAEQERPQVEETKPEADEVHVPLGPISKKLAKLGQETGGTRREGGGGRTRRKLEVVREKGPQGLMISEEQARAIFSAYEPLDAGVEKEEPLAPIVLEGPLPRDHYLSFFSVVKAAFEPLNDRKGELGKLMKNVRQILRTPECCVCSWFHDRSDWVDQVLGVVCYLAAEVGAVSNFSPLPHFVPLVEFKDRIDHWKWIGHGRDSDLELMILCNHWFKLLDKTLPIVDYSDYEPPPPHVWTSYVFRRSTPHEVARFRQLERERYSCPHKAFIYHVHGFEAPVGPVKGSRVTKKDSGSRARGHVLLIPDRPTCVTILSLVRDAASRLPNGEGTRLDLCVLVQDSQFLADSVSETQLNNAVSGALDRLHYEKDPCVRYDAPRKVWIYLHRGRTEEDFERIYWACEVASKQRKMLMSRPKVKPKIIVKTDGKEVVVEQGGVVQAPMEDIGKPVKKTGKAGPTGSTSGGLPAVATLPKLVGGVLPATATAGGGGGSGSVVMASVLPSSKSQVMAAAKSGKGVLQVTAPPQPCKAPSTQKPSRRRKPTPKVAERLKQQGAESQQQQKSCSSGSTAANLTTSASAPLGQADSDFDSSDEDTLLPFLDSSLSEKERRPSQDSTSSWQSSNSDTNDHPISIDLASVTHGHTTHVAARGAMATPTVPTPTFLGPISMEGEDVLGGAGLGETEPGTTGVGGASQWLSPPSASSTSSSNNSAE